MDSTEISRAFSNDKSSVDVKKIKAKKQSTRLKQKQRLIILDSDEEDQEPREEMVEMKKYDIEQRFEFDPTHLPIVRRESYYWNPLTEEIKGARRALFEIYGPILPLGSTIKADFNIVVPFNYLRNKGRKHSHGEYNMPILDLSKTIIDVFANRDDECGVIGNDANLVDCQISLNENAHDTDDGTFHIITQLEEIAERAHPELIMNLTQSEPGRVSFSFTIDESISNLQPRVRFSTHSPPIYTSKQTREIKSLARKIELLNYNELTRLKFWCASEEKKPSSIVVVTYFPALTKGERIQKFKTSSPDVDNMLRLLLEAFYSHNVIHPDHIKHLRLQKIRCAHPLFALPKETTMESTQIRLYID